MIGLNRPLSKDKSDIDELYKNRYQIYLSCSDFIVYNKGKIKDAVNSLVEKYNEFINHKN